MTREKVIVISALVLIVFAFLFNAAPVLAQQDVEMSREVRVLVQKGLTALGFDAGSADGLFGRKTRAAIWDWQEAKGLGTSGYISQEEAEALAAAGVEAAEKQERGSASTRPRPGVAREKPASAARAEPSAPRKAVGKVFRTPRCIVHPDRESAKAAGPCWHSVENHEDCDFLTLHRWQGLRLLKLTWSGKCEHNAAQGKGVLQSLRGPSKGEGMMVDGKQVGRWTLYNDRAGSFECDFVEGLLHKCVFPELGFTSYYDENGWLVRRAKGLH